MEDFPHRWIQHKLVKIWPWQKDCDQYYLAECLIPLVYLALDLPTQRNLNVTSTCLKLSVFLFLLLLNALSHPSYPTFFFPSDCNEFKKKPT